MAEPCDLTAVEAAVMRGDVLPPIYGLPVGIKDLNETEGMRNTYGSLLFREHVPDRDLLMVAAIRRAGGIVLGFGGHEIGYQARAGARSPRRSGWARSEPALPPRGGNTCPGAG